MFDIRRKDKEIVSPPLEYETYVSGVDARIYYIDGDDLDIRFTLPSQAKKFVKNLLTNISDGVAKPVIVKIKSRTIEVEKEYYLFTRDIKCIELIYYYKSRPKTNKETK